jgi:hypothetical protein
MGCVYLFYIITQNVLHLRKSLRGFKLMRETHMFSAINKCPITPLQASSRHVLSNKSHILMCVAPCIFVYDYNYLHQQMHNYFFIKHTPRLHVST